MTYPIDNRRSGAPPGSGPVGTSRSRSALRAWLPASASGVRTVLLAVLIATAWSVPTRAAAQVEVEADPLAYALNGFSLHLAGILGSHRLSVGTFGIDVPRFFYGDDDWSIVMRGVGIKWDFLGAHVDGFFVGADAGYMRMSYTLDEAAETAKRNEFNVGVRGGYRLPIGRAGLYISPWIGVGYSFGDDVTIGEQTFEHSPITVFPTVHIGWRF